MSCDDFFVNQRRNIILKTKKVNLLLERKPKQSNLKIQKNLNLNKILDFINI